MTRKCPCGSPAGAARIWHRTRECHDCVYHPTAVPSCMTCRGVKQIYEYLEQRGDGNGRAVRP